MVGSDIAGPSIAFRGTPGADTHAAARLGPSLNFDVHTDLEGSPKMLSFGSQTATLTRCTGGSMKPGRRGQPRGNAVLGALSRCGSSRTLHTPPDTSWSPRRR